MEAVDAVDKITQLKNTIINVYAKLILKMQKGYTFDNYQVIVEAMKAISFIENFDLPPYKVTTIIDFYLRKLNKL